MGQKQPVLLPGHKIGSQNMFPSLATMRTMLVRFQCCSLKMFASNAQRTTMADREVEVEEPQAGDRKGKGQKEINRKDEGREILVALYDCLWDVAHEDCMNRDKKEVACCRVEAQISEK